MKSYQERKKIQTQTSYYEILNENRKKKLRHNFERITINIVNNKERKKCMYVCT